MYNSKYNSNADKNQLTGILEFASLSRDALYTPLNAYVNASNNQRQKKQNVNNNVKEKSLFEFLEKISVEYHSSTSKLGKFGGTNGGTPLRSRHMEAKAAQRALTLIGNGCNVPTAKSTSAVSNEGVEYVNNFYLNHNQGKNKSNFMHGSLSKRKRKRVTKTFSENLKDVDVEKIKLLKEGENQNFSKIQEAVIGLNSIWKVYIKDLLHRNNLSCVKEESAERWKVARLISNAELIGAEVLIKDEASDGIIHTGVLIDESKNTWTIVSLCDYNNTGLPQDVKKMSRISCHTNVVTKSGNSLLLGLPHHDGTLDATFSSFVEINENLTT